MKENENTTIKNQCPRSETLLRPSEVSSSRCPYCWKDGLILDPLLPIPNHSRDPGLPDAGFLWNRFLGRKPT